VCDPWKGAAVPLNGGLDGPQSHRELFQDAMMMMMKIIIIMKHKQEKTNEKRNQKNEHERKLKRG